MATQSAEISQTGTSAGMIYVTLSGLPVFIDLHWPFRQASSGADFYVLHSELRLADGSGLKALAAVNLSLTVKEVLPSLDPQHTEGPVINALRKEVDRKQLEFVKSPKLVPVHFNSRYYSFKNNQWAFPSASDDEVTQLLLRKVYWTGQSGKGETVIADPVDALYINTTLDRLRQLAQKLATQGLIKLTGDTAVATEAISKHADSFQADMKIQLEELQKKHTFERG
ncbi:MAG: hypothetical protein ACXVZX_00545 [Terriglobales bacterium]